MCKKNEPDRRAFWSIDAAFAIVLTVAMFAMLSALLYSAGISAGKGADETSGTLLSARFSSYALSRMEAENDIGLKSILGRTGRNYTSLRTANADGETSFDSAGEKPDEIYCTRRIAIRDGKMMRLEACVG